MLITAAKFAAQCGVSRQAVYKAASAGALELKDGKIDTASASAREYLGAKKAPETAVPTTTQTPGSKNVYDMERSKQGAIRLALQNAKTKGTLIARADVERFIIEPINTAHTRALTDGARSIAALVHPMVMGGAPVEEVEVLIKKQLSSFFLAAKKSAEALLMAES